MDCKIHQYTSHPVHLYTLIIEEHIPIGPKTTMRIGGTARYYAELLTKQDVDEAIAFSIGKNIPLILFGAGANTIFADGEVNALVARMQTSGLTADGNLVTVEAGTILGSLINDLAKRHLDLSALTGIPGTIGGSIFGNAGQGPRGMWINAFVESVEAHVGDKWHVFSRSECNFRYRESVFKDMVKQDPFHPPIIWKATLKVPSRPEAEVKAEVERLLKLRIETQPHLKTAGSCFKALPDGTPAWQLIDKAGLRGLKIGGVQIAEKHANFLLNVEKGTFKDALAITKKIRDKVPQIAGVEMRFYGEDGALAA